MKGKQKLGLWSAIAFLSLLLVVSCSPVNIFPRLTTNDFAKWCFNKANLHSDTAHTIDVLLRFAGTTDCKKADQKLSTLSTLSLENNQISDIQPLSNLTNLTSLNLYNNQISDIKPLSNLTKLTDLYLPRNPIPNKTCPVKPESICTF